MHMCADLIYVCMPRLNPVRLTKSTRKNLIEIEQTIIDRCKACKKNIKHDEKTSYLSAAVGCWHFFASEKCWKNEVRRLKCRQKSYNN